MTSRGLFALLVASLVALVSTPLLAQPTRSSAASALLKRAELLLADGQTSRAMDLLKRAMQRAPQDPAPVARFAELALPRADSEDAVIPPETVRANARLILEAIQQVAQRDDSGVGDRAERLEHVHVWALVFARSLPEAIERWRTRAVRLDREHTELGQQLATLAVRREDLATAHAVLRECLRLNPEDATLRADLGAVALARGDTTEALVLFRDVTAANPSDLNAQRDLAGAYLAHGDAVTAVTVLRTNPSCSQDCDCALELTRAAVTAKRFEVAIEAAGHALRHCDDRDPEPLLWLALAEQGAGRTLQARTAYRLALRRDPNSVRAQRGLQGLQPTARPTN